MLNVDLIKAKFYTDAQFGSTRLDPNSRRKTNVGPGVDADLSIFLNKIRYLCAFN